MRFGISLMGIGVLNAFASWGCLKSGLNFPGAVAALVATALIISGLVLVMLDLIPTKETFQSEKE